MKELDDYITKNYDILVETSRGICNNNQEYLDIAHESIIVLLNLPLDKQINLLDSKKIKYYYIKIIQLSHTSKSSSYQRKYNKDKHKTKSLEETFNIEYQDQEYDTLLDDIESIIETLKWDEKKIVDLHIKEGLTFTQMAKKTKIPRSGVCKIWKEAKQSIRDNYKNKYE